LQHELYQPKEVEAEEVQWEMQEADEVIGMEHGDEMEEVLDGLGIDAHDGELESSNAQEQKGVGFHT
jgi:hypothetical protein